MDTKLIKITYKEIKEFDSEQHNYFLTFHSNSAGGYVIVFVPNTEVETFLSKLKSGGENGKNKS